MGDLDDLDILASLADSDLEFNEDDDIGEAIPPGNTSPKSAATQQHRQQEHSNEQQQIAQPQSVEEMAAQIATMNEYIKRLEAERNELKETTGNGRKLLDSDLEIQHSTSSLTKSGENSTTKPDTSARSLFSKEVKRISHTALQSMNQQECSSSSTGSSKRKLSHTVRDKANSDHSEHISAKGGGGLGLRQKRGNAEDMGLVARNVREELVTRKTTPDDDKVLSEKYSGLRILNPLISSVVMKRRMEGRKMVKISQIPLKIKGKGDIDGDWVTIGVIVQKLPPKKSSNGKTYGIWKLSDLGANSTNELIALFLFGDVYKEHWKTVEGSIVALLNASLLPAKEKNSKDLALTLDNHKKLMLMGISKDFGKCKGLRKSDNHPCGNYINRQHGEFCEFHVQAAYKKMKSQRMECQAGYAPSAKAPLMKKFHKDLNNSTFMYQGRTVSASTHPTEHKKKNVTLKSLGVGSKSAIDIGDIQGDSNHKQEPKTGAKPSEFLVELLTLPTVGTRNLVKHLNQDEEQMDSEDELPSILGSCLTVLERLCNIYVDNKKFPLEKPPEEKRLTMSASDLLKAHEKEIKNHRKSQSANTVSPRLHQNSKQAAPTLGRGLEPGLDVFFDESPILKKRKPSDMDRAKLRALSLVKQKGPIEKEDPNAMRKKLSPKGVEQIEKRACEESMKENIDENQDSSRKRRRILGPEFGSIDFESDEVKKILAAKSKHVGAVREAEAEREEKYFSELEKKEQLEDKMKTIMEIKVNVVFCKQCNYVAESASKLCYKENHKLTHLKTLKKFFVCRDCKQRSVTYGATPIPKHPCRNCGSTNYQKTSLYKEKEGPKIGGETLLVRGEEVPKFLNSLK